MLRTFLLCGVMAAAAISSAQIVWDEGVNGDLSGNRFSPSSVQLNVGSNVVIGATSIGDLDYLHIRLDPGETFSQLRVNDYFSNDFYAFIGIQAGTTFTEDPENPTVGNLLGWALFGPNEINTDILPLMGQGSGAIGFTPPLTGSDYTFWIQQLGEPTQYELDFVVVPEPSTMALGAGVAMLIARRRKRR